MSSRRSIRQLLVAVLFGVLVGGGLMVVTPAGADVSSAIATNWKKIWKKELKQHASKDFYTKKRIRQKFQPKGSYDPAGAAAAAQAAADAATDAKLGNYDKKTESDAKYSAAGSSYSKTDSDARYSAAGSSYSKAESDAKYAPYPNLIKGTYIMTTTAAAAGAQVGSDISFGYTLPVAPFVHYIPTGAVVPAGCSGTVEAPNAAAGHLCVFEGVDSNASAQRIYNASGTPTGASRMGALLNATSTAAGSVFVYGSWAVRPASVSGNGMDAKQQADAGNPTLGR